jgi:hypothetical protein
VCEFDESKKWRGNAATLQGSLFQRTACSTKQACCFREEDPIPREMLAIATGLITDRLKNSLQFSKTGQDRDLLAAFEGWRLSFLPYLRLDGSSLLIYRFLMLNLADHSTAEIHPY